MKDLLKKTLSVVGAALMLVFVLCGAALAQEITGSLNGSVRDSNGGAVVGATVTISDPAKDNVVVRTLTTNEDGEYSAPNLPVSIYTLTVEAATFKKAVQTNIKIDVGQRRTEDIVLEAGNIAETVTVEADPVAVELNTPTAATTINGEQVRELSLNNRNFVQLVTLAPGVSNNQDDIFELGTTDPDTANGAPNTMNISVNGARSSANTYTVDGADITDRGSNLTIQAYPNIDSIGEFRVLRSLYPAESGRSGGGQINAVTRSGGDRFSGTLFEFFRNEKLNANDYFTNQTGAAGFDVSGKAKRRPFRYNNFGWTLGGPVYFLGFGEGGPAIKKYERTFFFYAQEFRYDIRYPSPGAVTVPSAGLEQGVFTVPICVQPFRRADATGNPYSCDPQFPGVNGARPIILPAGTPLSTLAPISRVAQAYISNVYANVPNPNSPTPGSFSLAQTSRNEVKFREELIKIDHRFTDKWSAFYRFQNDTIPSIDANAIFSSGSGIPGVSTTRTQSPGRTHTFYSNYAINPNMIVEGRYARAYGAILSSPIGYIAQENFPLAINLPFASERNRVPTITGNGFTGLSGFGPYDNFSTKDDISGSFTWIAGNHTMKFGGSFSKYRKNENALAGNNEGIFNEFFNTPRTDTASAPVSVVAPGGSTVQQSFANFLLGTNVTFAQDRFDYTADLRQRNIELYAQDEYKVRRNLTLYYGLRYSVYGMPYDKNGRLANFDPMFFDPAKAPQVSTAGVRTGGDFFNGLIFNAQNDPTGSHPSPYGKQVVKTPYNNFAPRIGLAWDPFGKGETSIRTGYGIYHEQILNGIFLNSIGTNPRLQERVNITRTTLDEPTVGLNGQTPTFVSTTAVPNNIFAVQADFETPYYQHWSLDLQQQLAKKTIMTIGYYGSKGTHLIGAIDINLLPPGEVFKRTCPGSTNPGGVCLNPGTAFFSAAATNAVLDPIRPYRGYRGITYIAPRFNSNYHSLQFSAQQRFSGASQINVAYTWSKNLTDNISDRTNAPQNPYNISTNYGRAPLDRRHIFTTNFIYELPFFSKRNGLAGMFLGGWQASGIVTYQTGTPLTITTSAFDPAGIGIIPSTRTVARPNQIGNPNENAPNTQQQWFNTSAFQLNPLSTATNIQNIVGTAPIGSVFGPRTFRTDLTLVKNIYFSETMRLQLRGEAFNLFNTTNFRAVSTNVTAANFGQVTSTRDPRTMQLALKFYF